MKTIQKPAVDQEKKDNMRESAKRALLKVLQGKCNSQDNFKFTPEELSDEIEKNVYEKTGNNSQNKEYREKIKLIEMRLNGNSNTYIREALRRGNIEVVSFSTLDNKVLNDTGYFQSKYQKKTEENKQNQFNVNENRKYHKIKPLPIPMPQIQFIDNTLQNEPIEEWNNEKPITEEEKKETILNDNPYKEKNKIHLEENPLDSEEIIAPQQEFKDQPNTPSKVEEQKQNDPVDQIALNESSSNESKLDLHYLKLLKETLEQKKKKKLNVDTKKKKKASKKNPNQPTKEPIKQEEQIDKNQNKPEAEIPNQVNLFTEENPNPIPIVLENNKEKEPIIEPQSSLKETKEEVKENDTDSIIKKEIVILNEGYTLFESRTSEKHQKDTPMIDCIREPQTQTTQTNEEQKPSIDSNSKSTEEVKSKSQFELNKPLISASKSQRHINQFGDNNNIINRNDNNENGLSSSQYDSSLMSFNIIKEKYKATNEAKLSLETKVELMKYEALSYQKEITALKSALNQSRQSSAQSSEEILKLEIIKTKQLLKNQETEKEFQIKENNKLKTQIKTYEDNFASMIDDNKLFRIETERRFAVYQKEIDELRNQLSTHNLINPMAMSQIYNPTGMDKMININNEDKIHNELFDNGIPEQNLLSVNDNKNMNGNIYDATKNELIYDTASNRGIFYSDDDNQFDFKQKNVSDDNKEEEEFNIQGNEMKQSEMLHNDNNQIDINMSNSNNIDINNIINENQKNDNEFEIVNAEDFNNNSSVKKKEEVSPKKEMKQQEVQSPINNNKQDPKKNILNNLFDNSDDENEDIFKTNPQKNSSNIPKKDNNKSSMQKAIPQPSTNIKPKPIPQPSQQKSMLVSTTINNHQQPQKKPETKQKLAAPVNLFNDLENEMDEEIFNKQDGESIFGKSEGNTLFD